MLVPWVHGWVHGISSALQTGACQNRDVVELTLVDVTTRGERHGFTARELLDLRPASRDALSPAALEAWLLDEGLAETNGVRSAWKRRSARAVPLSRPMD
jgi:hypothetical protein